MECNVCFTSWLSQNTELIFSRNVLLQPQDVITDWYRSVQSPACEIGFNPQILLYIYLHWKPFAIFQSLTLKKLFYNFSVFPYPCYPEKLHQHSLSSHHLSLFPGHLWWCCTVLTLQSPLDDFFFPVVQDLLLPTVSCCVTNYLSTPGPVALSKMCHMILLCDCQCFFPFSPCL